MNNTKKISIIILLIIIVSVVATLVVIFTNLKDESSAFTDRELDDMEYVDQTIRDLIQSEEYKKLDLAKREAEAKSILNRLKKEKYIKNIYYDKNNYMFSFKYSSGALGGLMIKEFDPMLN